MVSPSCTPKSSPAFHSLPEICSESRVVFARVLGVGFFLGRSCFHGWRFGNVNKSESEIQVFLGFLRFILLYNIKLLWTPHKECMKIFRLSTSLNSNLWIAQLRAATLLLSAPASSRLGLSITKMLFLEETNKRLGPFVNSKTPFVPTALRPLGFAPPVHHIVIRNFHQVATCQLRHGDTQALLCNMTWGDILHRFHSWAWRNHNGRGVLLGNVPYQQ